MIIIYFKILCKACKIYQVIVDDYCLMSNHFNLLIETKLNNLSIFMKHINSNYAICSNKKRNCLDHFWKGRFYSLYIDNEKYYYKFIRYIEQNPIKARLSDKVAQYPYALGSVIANRQEPISYTKDSKLLQELIKFSTPNPKDEL